MYCTSPVTIRIKNKDSAGEMHYINGHLVESRTRKVRCHSCLGCRINDTLQTTVRLVLEKKMYAPKMCSFLTLTYDDEHMPLNRSLDVDEIQRFNKRLRERFLYEAKKNGSIPIKYRYYVAGEYGDQEDKGHRPHYHLALFGVPPTPEVKNIVYDEWRKCSPYMILNNPDGMKLLENYNMEYIAGYVQKKLKGPKAEEEYTAKGRIPPFSLSSTKLGLSGFLEKKELYERDGFILYSGMKVPIPRYYVDKLGLVLPKATFENSPYRELLVKYKLISDDLDKRLLVDSYQNQCDLYQTMIPNEFRDNLKKILEAKNNLFKRGKL